VNAVGLELDKKENLVGLERRHFFVNEGILAGDVRHSMRDGFLTVVKHTEEDELPAPLVSVKQGVEEHGVLVYVRSQLLHCSSPQISYTDTTRL
jgi:hypothetical protein